VREPTTPKFMRTRIEVAAQRAPDHNTNMTQGLLPRMWLFALSLAAVDCSTNSEPVKREVDASARPIRAAVHSNAALAQKLANALKDEAGNLFYSPLSIEAVTGMLFAGAAENTAAQLAELLDAEGDQEPLHEGLGALLRDLSHDHPQYSLSIANRLWAIPGLDSSQAFVATTREDYNAPTERVSFDKDPEAARTQINAWVSDQTKDKIPELLKQGQITKDTVMAVVNAIYFKADWATAFDVALTQDRTFNLTQSSMAKVPMMHRPKAKLRTKLGPDARARWLELPYRTGEVSFLAYTRETWPPTNDQTVASVEELQTDIENVDLAEVVAGLTEVESEVEMPRFSMRSRLNLVPIFKQLGVTDLFDSERADLSNISANTKLVVDPFVHEAAVWVDELGTVAVAATASGAVATSASLPITLDHPFLFWIRDNRTGAILFSGRLADPRSTAD
jgi:serine protease inhibitor